LRFDSYTTAELFAAAVGKVDPLGEEEKSQEKTTYCQQRGNIGIFLARLARLDTPRDGKGFDSKVHAEKREIKEKLV